MEAELENMWKETFVAYFKPIFHKFQGGAE
jgi:hypothetical protein